MICSRILANADEDPFDQVMRKAADIKVRVSMSCSGNTPLEIQDDEIARVLDTSKDVIPEFTFHNHVSTEPTLEPLYDQLEIDALLEE